MEEDKRDSLIFYRSFYEALKEVDNDTKAKVYDAIFEYSLNFNDVELTGLAKAMFTLIKPQLDANNQRFKNGNKGGRPKKDKPNDNQEITKTKPNDNQNETKTKANNNVNVNDNVNKNENDNILLEKETKYTNTDFKNDLINYGFKENLVIEWLQVRKTKKATNSKTAFNKFIKQVELNGNDKNFILETCVAKSWSGFEATYNLQGSQPQYQQQKPATPFDNLKF